MEDKMEIPKKITWTYNDYLLFPEGFYFEIMNGEIYIPNSYRFALSKTKEQEKLTQDIFKEDF